VVDIAGVSIDNAGSPVNEPRTAKGTAMSSEDRVENVTRGEDMPPPEEDVITPMRDVSLTSDEKMWAMFCHLSALITNAFSGMGFLGPLICWLVKKDSSSFVDAHGKEALNFQLNMLIYFLISIAIAVVTCGVGIVLPIALAIYAFIMPIIAGVKANGGEMYRYPLTFRMIT
jgi:uncharacterized Tic20 family protein